MKIIGQRLRELRQNAKLSQARIAALIGTHQPVIARYESGEANVPGEVLLVLADYYDVSLDYLYGRTDNPQGRCYEYKPKIEKAYPEMEKFVEMCFDPNSAMNERLKETLLQMLKEGQK